MATTKPETPQARLPQELRDSTSFLLKRLGHAAKERALDVFEATGLTPYHYAVLLALAEDSHETQGAIADALGYDRGQLVGLLDELEERALVERRRDPADRRRQLVSEKPRSVLMDGRATFTIATSRMTMNWAVTMSANALQRR